MSFKIGSYSIETQEIFAFLQGANIKKDSELKQIDKNGDKKISEDEFVEIKNLAEEDSTNESTNSAASSNTNGVDTSSYEAQIIALQQQIDALEEQRNMVYNKLGTDDDLDSYTAIMDEAESITSQINNIKNQVYQCYYNMEMQIQQAQNAANAATGVTGTTPVDTTSGGTYTYSGNSAQFVSSFNNSSFNKGILAGKGAMVASVAEKYGLDPNLFAAIIGIETGYGTSNAIKNYNNPGGMMDPSSNWMKLTHYSSLQEGLEAMARNLKKNYIDKGLTTVSSIGAKYCPVGAANDPNGTNSGWVPSVVSIYNQLTGAKISSSTKIA